MEECGMTWRVDKYYINVKLPQGYRHERIIPKLKFIIIKFFNRNKYNIEGYPKNVLYEID